MSSSEISRLVDELEGQVNNGGFHQFFFNSAGDCTAETISALDVIGAHAVADLLKRAAGMFPNGSPPKDRQARIEVLRTSFPKTDEFRTLDEEFFAYPDDLASLLENYVLKTGGSGPK